jgi:hypothetical protein
MLWRLSARVLSRKMFLALRAQQRGEKKHRSPGSP